MQQKDQIWPKILLQSLPWTSQAYHYWIILISQGTVHKLHETARGRRFNFQVVTKRLPCDVIHEWPLTHLLSHFQIGLVMAEKETEISGLQLEMKTKEDLITSYKSCIEKKSEKIDGLKDNVSNLINTIAAYKTKAKEQITLYQELVDVTTREKTQLPQEIEHLKKMADSLRKELDSSNELSDFLKGELDASENIKDNLRTKLQSEKESNASLKKQLEILKESHAASVKKDSLKNSAEKSTKELVKLADTLQADLNASNEFAETLKKKVSESKRKIKELKEKVKEFKEEKENLKNGFDPKEIDRSNNDKNAAMEEEKNEIKKQLLNKEEELKVLLEETNR